jgi:glycosyltransferase involved in cell wall biosynthesis
MKITFVGPAISRFVQNDIHILSREHELTVIDSAMGRGRSAVFNLIKLHLKIIASVISSDAVFYWFADYYTYLPTLVAKLIGKKTFVIAGGFDVAYIPEVKSGARTRKGRWFMVRNTFRSVDHIFPVSNYALSMLRGSVPDHAPATVIYNAVDTSRFLFGSGERKNIALTVTQLDTILDYRLKGIDIFLKAAANMQDTSFELIGIRGPALEHARFEAKDIPNVSIVEGPVEFAYLLDKYHTASAYCQLSMDESFGVATAEAMSCGCIPVVSQVPSLEEVTGKTGHIVSREKISEISDAIRATFTASIEGRKRASDYVRKFDIGERAKQLLEAVRQT